MFFITRIGFLILNICGSSAEPTEETIDFGWDRDTEWPAVESTTDDIKSIDSFQSFKISVISPVGLIKEYLILS